MSKILNTGFLAIIFRFCILFLIGSGADDMFEIEKRELRELPSLAEYSLDEMPEKYTEYISDHFPLRRSIMKAASVGSYKLFGSIRSDAVVLGKNRFLFLNTMDTTSPRKDYQGLNLFTDSQQTDIKTMAERLKESAQARGQRVILMVIPNKEEVYSQYLPESFNRVNDFTKRQQFYNLIKETGLEILDVTDNIKRYTKNDDDIYFRADTHWTGKGAYVGAEALLQTLGIDFIPYENNTFTKGSYYESDIANLCNLYDEYTDTFDLDAEKDICEEKSEMSITFVGDSFRWRMTEYLNESFQVVNIFDHNVSQEELMSSNSDILVIEVVERNLEGMMHLIPRAVF